ncbi:8899_t:CDS:1, partial [Scutellospora calospora]
YQRNKNKEKNLELISNTLDRKTISTPFSLTQEMCIDEYPKNSSTKKQQDIFRTSESNNTQASVSKRTEGITITTKNTNIKKDSKTQEISLTNAIASDKKIAQEVNSPMVIIDNNNHELQELDCSEEEYIIVTNKRKKDKKKVSVQNQEETRTAPYKKKTRNESQNMQI